MDFQKYYEAKNIITEIIRKDLMGPVDENEIICDERPVDYYITGKIYPRDMDIQTQMQSPSEDCGEFDDEEGISLNNSRYPSSFGLSFSLCKAATEFTVIPGAAKYYLITGEEAQEKLNFKEGKYRKEARFWQRSKLNLSPIKITIGELSEGKPIKVFIFDNLLIYILLHKIYSDGSKTISVTMINEEKSDNDYLEDCLKTIFQPEICITSEYRNAFRDVRRNIQTVRDPDNDFNVEVAELSMLYSKVGDYASGHGCAVNWDFDETGAVTVLKTEFLPEYELRQMMPSAHFKHKILGMKYLFEASHSDIISGLNSLLLSYGEWIGKTEMEAKKMASVHRDSATRNLTKCRATLKILRSSIDALSDADIFRAFVLANKVMFMQRKQILVNNKKFECDEKIQWYPFQLAFFLQEIVSFADTGSGERRKVDLLWFPTGGGKTEAYLGIAAFVIFLRRLRYKEKGDGVTVLMRYTLRLLSFQQFERAAALICACEIVRKEEGIQGGEIGIGLWVGRSLTPNKIAIAEKILKGEEDPDVESSNPTQLEKCPWCGASIPSDNYICNRNKKRMNIKCGNTDCSFKNGLPLYLIDEEIYEYKPSFIIATVDKFAQVALNSDTFALFGKVDNKLPPELIIQDELHLISGPLGTITGIYEAAIKKLCERDGVYPKVIASTATIRNAKEQIRNLYASGYTQFPPQGIDINDSFFAELSTKETRPARRYLGCMAIGTSPTTMMIRVMASMLYATRYLVELEYDEKIIDSFWTITGYFNTLRELGGALIRVVDDIQDRYSYLRMSKFDTKYPTKSDKTRYERYKELTSRESSANIGNVIQNELEEPYRADGTTNPYDFLLSSNMISVGIDVGRLGTMIVVGQPKTTSEYIQATSRVGRETPGLVVTTYNQAKSRDRSHYEDFRQYHSTFYKFVEATSVTPFSDRARDRALQALYIILCRNLIPDLADDIDAINFGPDMPELQKIRDYILSYVDLVDPAEHGNVIRDIAEIEDAWEQKCARREKLRYRKTKWIAQNEALFEPDYKEGSRLRVLNTMRSVETAVRVITKES